MATDDKTTTPVDATIIPSGTANPEIAGNPPAPNVNLPRPDMSWGSGPPPVMAAGMTFSEVGSSGLRQFSGWVREEFLQQLVGRQGAQKYREMVDNSATIGGVLFGINALMRKVEWRVTPANDSGEAQEAAEFLESCMDDMSHTWEDLIVENLSMLPYGYAPHEIVYKKRLGRDPGRDPTSRWGDSLPTSQYDDGKVGWRRIPLRGQDTIIKWFFDENGTTKGMTQQPWTGPIINIPIEKLLLMRPNAHKNNPEGRSILRTSYIAYYYIKRLQEQEAILFERMGGVPLIKIPGALIQAAAAGNAIAAATVAMYKRIAINLRTDEQMGVLLPSDMWPSPTGGTSSAEQYKFELVTPQLRASNLGFDATIQRYGVNMMTSVLADFLSLGHEARGTQSLAVSKIDLFFQAIEGFLNSMAAVYNRYAIPRLWQLNGMDEDQMPNVEPDLAQRVDLDVLSNFILRLSQAGMPLFPDEDLQSYIKDAAGLPDITDDRALQAAGMTDDQLEMQDEKDQAMLDNLQNPPQPNQKPPPPKSNLEKMINAAIAKRMIRMRGPRFNVRTTRIVSPVTGKHISKRALLTRSRKAGSVLGSAG